MSNYTKSTDFAAKDALATGDPLKVVKGSEIGTEFDNVQTAVNSKADSSSPAFSGTASGLTVKDDFGIVDNTDTTKKLLHEIAGVTTATTRNWYVEDCDANVGMAWEIKNCSIVSSVAANALTVALKTKAGSDLSSTNPIIFKFRNNTAATGDYSVLSLTAATSLVVSSGSTLGTASGIAHRLYVVVFNDAGTLRLGIYNPYNTTGPTLIGLSDGIAYSSTAEGGAGAADSAQVIYTGTAVTSKYLKVIGYIESTQATAGTWASTPSKINILRPGDYKTGDIIQKQLTVTGAVATGTTTIPNDDSIPLITEGDQFMSQAITPTSAINLMDVFAQGVYTTNAAAHIVQSIFQDSSANLGCTDHVCTASGNTINLVTKYMGPAGTTSATTFKVRAGGNGGPTTTFNGAGGARTYGGAFASRIEVTEIMV